MTLFNVPDYLDWPAQFCLLITGITWIASIVTSNVSQVDRFWTFLPTIYTAYYALLPLLPNSQPFLFVPYAPKSLGWSSLKDFSPRALLMLTLITIWMFRLSYNTYRRGLFNLQDEDYRWAVLRKQLPPWLFQVTNLTFISGIQNVLLLLLGLPTYVASVLQPHTSLTTVDYQLTLIAFAILICEFTADNQQFAFHAYKHAYLAKEKGEKGVKPYNPKEQWPGARLAWTPNDAKRGFITRGLWRYSRHPNFACEQSFWWLMTIFPLMEPSANSPLPKLLEALENQDAGQLRAVLLPSLWFFMPALALSTLFFSSTLYTEQITSSKYTAYSFYQRRVGMFTPLDTLVRALKVNLLDGKREAKLVYQKVWGASQPKIE
ncbi:hypothetical protein JR316_0006212 [Psilocybe cubensis]|uniref:DUF1295-domain-containing protein n=2 Tax=Psilocybe cubensis TaxID=181762 RepID=A0A8H7Y3D2_PSICU|nr:hypothetical protein JR316_0006212 [Psilocybe cubensis]KAH9481685.1 hypothetical protein JR316_0006212 [Psilocybe cubensis]